jgi:hypothetical protein
MSMIDSSALLLAIVMTTPAEYLDEHSNNNYVSFNSLGDIMQRLCWPHTHTNNMQCEAKSGPTAVYQDTPEKNLIKALNTFRSLKRNETISKRQ